MKTIFSLLKALDKKEPLFKFLFQVFIFLLPTQLGLHFWPAYAHVFGVRIDYLSPTLFLTDILFIVLFVLWFIQNLKTLKLFDINKDKRKAIIIFVPLLVFVLINVSEAFSPALSFLRWLKILEIGLFVWFVSKESDKIKDWIVTPLSLAVIFYSLIGIYQFIVGETLGKAAYWLGERSFNLATPGIAIVNFLGQIHLRAYSTFSHPNSLAGFLLVALILIILNKSKDRLSRRLIYFSVILGSVCFFLTFSQASFLSIPVIVLLGILLYKRERLGKSIVQLLFFVLLLFSLILPIISDKALTAGREYSLSIKDRFILASASGHEILKAPVFGVGMNNFIPNLLTVTKVSGISSILQPVHNISLLVISETGIVGFLIFSFLIYKSLIDGLNNRNISVTLSLMTILLTGFIDHYWLTLQQNIFLSGLILGLSLKTKNK